MSSSPDNSSMPSIWHLSRKQLQAYNTAELDAFCSHYHPDIEVFDASGTCTLRGMPDFRARYAEMFASHRDVRGIVDQQIILPPHIVERETWSRVSLATGVRTEGVVLVRYTEQDGKIRFAEFLRP